MPDNDVMALSAPVAGIVGKLPGHGDFIRRGGPAPVLMRLDDWLDGELSAAITAGVTLEVAVAALNDCRFAFTAEGVPVVAVMVASGDRVGRVFPLVASMTGASISVKAAETWCAAAADALVAIRDGGQDADDALATVTAIDPPDGNDAGQAAGWWHPDHPAPVGTNLPVGEAFRALVLRGDA